MPKVGKLLQNTIEVPKSEQPWIDNGEFFFITRRDDKKRIIAFEVKYREHGNTFEVKNGNVLDAWKDFEAWFAKLK